MSILIACEKYGRVRDAFRKLGFAAFSCDIEDSEPDSMYHIHGDVREVLGRPWEMIIAFPPCTDICVSGARYFEEKRADGRQQAAIDFFMLLANARCDRIAIENPVGIMSTVWRKPDQIIQPWMFGHDASKKTCLWLKNLPRLRGTNVIRKNIYANQTPSGQNSWVHHRNGQPSGVKRTSELHRRWQNNGELSYEKEFGNT